MTQPTLADRVKETSNTTGTGNYALLGAVTTFRPFYPTISSGIQTAYAVQDSASNDWEVGLGTVTSGFLSRDTLYASSTGSFIDWGAGTRTIWCDLPAALLPVAGDSGSIAYSTGTALASSAAGTAGQALVSGGSGAPTFYPPTPGSVLFAGTNGAITQDNSNLFWDNVNKRYGIGTTSPTGILDIQGLAVNDLPTYSAEFLLGTGWTSAGWTGDFSTGWTHTTGNTTALSQSKPAVSATKYQIDYTVVKTAGTFNINFGGQALAGISATGSWGPTTSSTGSLVITPTSTFDGTIVISIKSITTVSTALVNLKSSDGTSRIEIRANTTLGSTFIGASAGSYNTTGSYNTAIGYGSIYYNTTGNYNTAIGYYSLRSNTTGTYNTAQGYYSLFSNTIGSYNTAIGYYSLFFNTTGSQNTAIGYSSLRYNTTGIGNTAHGYYSLCDLGVTQTAGTFNVSTSYTIKTIGTTDFTLIGASANTIGVVFTASGIGSGTGTATPNATNNNTAIGYNTGLGIIYGTGNTIIGANVTGLSAGLTNNIIISDGAGNQRINVGSTGSVGIGTTNPTATLMIRPGTATAGTAPIKLSSGTLLTTAEAGAIEFLTDAYYGTITTGETRRLFVQSQTGRATAQTAANASVLTFTPPADASFQIAANVLVTTSSAEAFAVKVSYTDEGNTARVATLNFQLLAGTIGTSIDFANGAVPYSGVPMNIRVKASTVITVSTVGTFTGATYNVEVFLKKLA